MHFDVNNLRVREFKAIPSPEEVYKQIHITDESEKTVYYARKHIQDILEYKDERKILIVGPCSIHNVEEGMEYAQKLNELRKKCEDKLVILMRAYFEKPRTTVGWKGLVYDPYLDESDNLKEGIALSRKFLMDVNDMGLATATEVLGPIVIQYYSDLISWCAIGARTTESQTHRELASGLSMPVGFKNGTQGNVDIAVNAILSSRSPHHFLGMDDTGKVSIVETTGNPYGHIILRGGENGANYSQEHIEEAESYCAKKDIDPNIIVDCSHANSEKDYKKQHVVWEEGWRQIKNGTKSIKGFMLESYIHEGNQKISDNLKKGVSITDSCISFEETEKLILWAYNEMG